ncbi:MAG TPA: hypothetical protein PLR91_00040 [Kiritimatiellia bacterium]|nr:hypothetical protein [Kiritimatiellia bacterium]
MRWTILAGCMLWGMAVRAAGPVLDYVYPAGGRTGSDFEVEVGGDRFSGVVQAVVSGEGVTLTYLGPVRTTVLNKKGRPVATVLPDRLRFRVVIDKEAAPGMRALRVSTAYRLSEPVGFDVQSALPELSEPATNRAGAAVCTLEQMPLWVNGRVSHKEPDCYRFEARQGMRIVACTQAATLPPNGFLPTLAFCDPSGNPCEGVTLHDAEHAPVAVFEVPRDGSYALRVGAAATAQTGDAHVYRVQVGELPLITGFTPSGAREGESLNVRLEGVNLPQRRIRLFTGGKDSALCLQAITEGAWVLPGLTFELDAESAAPDYRVTMTPASLNIPAEGSTLVNLHVQRFNGFEGEIRVALDFPPLSIASEGGVIPPGATGGVLTVSTDGVRYPRTVFGLALTATAELAGQPAKRAVAPVRRYRVAGNAREQVFVEPAARANAGMDPLRINIAPKTPLTVSVDTPVRLTLFSSSLAAHLGGLYEPVVLFPPSGFSVEGVQRTNKQERAAVLLTCDPRAMKPGATGQLVLGCIKRGDAGRVPLAVTQSVPFVVK